MSLVFLFPGQGSQSKGMGKEAFLRYPELVNQANSEIGYSLSDICLEDKDSQLGQTQYTQPALYLVSYLKPFQKLKMDNPLHSPLAIRLENLRPWPLQMPSFLDGLRMVSKRGQIMSQVSGGGMAAVIGLDIDKIHSTLEESGASKVDLANFNSPGQIVLSGPSTDIQAVLNPLKEAGARMVVPLKVSGAFHSRMMEGPASEFESFLKNFSFNTPRFPVYSNVEASPYQNGDSIAPLLVRQIHSSVLWSETISNIRKTGNEEFIECGPGNVLTKLLRQIP